MFDDLGYIHVIIVQAHEQHTCHEYHKCSAETILQNISILLKRSNAIYELDNKFKLVQ